MIKHLKILQFLLIIFSFLSSVSLTALPGDILFSDDFERVDIAPTWTTTNTVRSAISNQTSNSISRSLYTRNGVVSTTSSVINLSSISFAKVEMWVRRGSDAFSENPDANENLVIEYLDNTNSWVTLATYFGSGTQGEIFLLNEQLPISALHSGFRLQVRQTGGSGMNWDYWHIDDVIITETGYVPPPPPLAVGSCDDFEQNLNNWVISTSGGNITTSNATSQSPSMSLNIYAGIASATSLAINTTSNFKEVTVWIRRGSDTFSENPDWNEDFIIEYLNSSNTWINLETFLGSGVAGQIFNRTYAMPAAAKHANFKLRLRMLNASGGSFDHWHVDDVCLVPLAPNPSITLQKTSVVINDGINAVNPKRIPGALIDYNINASNSGPGIADNNTVIISDAIPANTALYVNDISGGGTGPVRFTDGSPPSGLSYPFISLASITDGVSFSKDNGANYNYTPVPDANGTDINVTNIRVGLSGQFLAPTGGGNPSFQLKFRVKVQ